MATINLAIERAVTEALREKLDDLVREAGEGSRLRLEKVLTEALLAMQRSPAVYTADFRSGFKYAIELVKAGGPR